MTGWGNCGMAEMGCILGLIVRNFRICEFWIVPISKANMLSRAKTLSVPHRSEWLPVEIKRSSFHYSCDSSDEFQKELQSQSNKEERESSAQTHSPFRSHCPFRCWIVYDIEISRGSGAVVFQRSSSDKAGHEGGCEDGYRNKEEEQVGSLFRRFGRGPSCRSPRLFEVTFGRVVHR